MMPQHQLTLLGATGSIGESTLRVVDQHPERLSIFALSTNRRTDLLIEQARRYHPCVVVVANSEAADWFKTHWSTKDGICPSILQGPQGLIEVASDPRSTTVMAAIVGAAGLPSTWAAAQAGKKILLANKEALVLAGESFMDLVRRQGAQVLPIDSEHNAIFQCLNSHVVGNQVEGVHKLLLTASGGPFRQLALTDFAHITPEQACAHPIWQMGEKISIDSATMMNKGLEIIEAHWLFGLPTEQIEAIIHPQGVVHSLVEFLDGSLLAQLGQADMQTPIAYALGYPERITSGVAFLDLLKCQPLSFEAIDPQRFPAVKLAYHALKTGQSGGAVLNGANEIAVNAFLRKQIRFDQIVPLVETTLDRYQNYQHEVNTLEALMALDQHARVLANEAIKGFVSAAVSTCG